MLQKLFDISFPYDESVFCTRFVKWSDEFARKDGCENGGNNANRFISGLHVFSLKQVIASSVALRGMAVMRAPSTYNHI